MSVSLPVCLGTSHDYVVLVYEGNEVVDLLATYTDMGYHRESVTGLHRAEMKGWPHAAASERGLKARSFRPSCHSRPGLFFRSSL